MITLTTNVRILKAERPGSYDRYGQSRLELLTANFRGHLTRAPRYERGPGGDVIEVDADLMLPKSVRLQPKDVVTLDNDDEERFEVFGVAESMDHMGQVWHRSYSLTKLREDS